jgi:hypothetical protein
VISKIGLLLFIVSAVSIGGAEGWQFVAFWIVEVVSAMFFLAFPIVDK